MQSVPLKPSSKRSPSETERLNALYAAEILDTAPEQFFDAMTRLAAEHFNVELAYLGFVDEDRVWVKSSWGDGVFELPRSQSVCSLVLEAGGPVVIPDVHVPSSQVLGFPLVRRLGLAFVAGVPVCASNGQILGALVLGGRQAKEKFGDVERQFLEQLANMVGSHMELARLQRLMKSNARRSTKARRSASTLDGQHQWPTPADLRHALDEDQFELYYQPELDLTNHKIIGLEALIRWNHPQRGLVFPDQFIPLSEKSGLFLPIGRWGLRNACEQIHTWTNMNPALSSLRVCVNLSAQQFAHSGLSDHIQSLLTEIGISGLQIGLEMTETSLISNIKSAVHVLRGLREMGITLLMDDFGTGYSSLNYLQTFSFDVLKIDRSFVMRLEEGDSPRQIVRTIIELARVLGMDVVAEGIETMEQYRLLRKMGCRYGQGYLFARPLPVAEVTKLLELPDRILPSSCFDTNVLLFSPTAVSPTGSDEVMQIA